MILRTKNRINHKIIKLLFRVFIAQVIFFCPKKIMAQEQTTEGQEFWMAFMDNGSSFWGFHYLRLFITSDVNTSGVVTIPQNPNCFNCTQTFTVSANSTTVVTLPLNQAHTINAGIQNTGIKITANDNISVFAVSNKRYSTDAGVILPIQSLGNDPKYIISDYVPSNFSNEYIILAYYWTKPQNGIKS